VKIRNRILATACAATMAWGAVGCSDKGDTAKGGADKGKPAAAAKAAELKAPDFLKEIPADTPYVFANFEALPKPVLDKIFKNFEPMLTEAQAAMDAELAKAADDPQAKLVHAILDELKGNMNSAGLEKLGFGTEPRFALYGIGVLPAFRAQIKDGAALKATIERIETKAGQKAPTKKLGDVEYWAIQNDGMTVAIALTGNEIRATFAPDAVADKVIGVLLGQTKPAKSLADSGMLQKVIGDYGFTPYGVGVIDTKKIADTILGDAQGLDGEIFAALKGGMPALSADCKGEIQGMVAKAPRVVFGYDKFDAGEMSASYIVELDGGLAKELGALRAPVPGLDAVPQGSPLMSVGAGIDLAKTIEFAKAKVNAIKAAPYKCEMLAGLNEGANDLSSKLEQPLPPFLTGVHGFYLVVKDADLSQGIGPQVMGSVKAYGVVSVDKPADLVTMAKGMVPPLAALDVKPDGKAVALPAGLAPMPANVAMNDKAIGVAVGAGMEGDLPGLLTAKAGEDPPLAAFSYDVGRIMKATSAQMKAMAAQMPPEMQENMKHQQAMQDAVANFLGLTSYSVHLNDKGIVLKQDIKLP
jgi:hypothetical protein